MLAVRVALLVVGFLLAAFAGWTFALDSGEQGANIGGPILLAFGSPVGLVGLTLSFVGLVFSFRSEKAVVVQ